MIEKIFTAYLKANKNVCTDSRNVIPGSLFFALKGEKFDGNAYAKKAIEDGASAAIIDNPDYQSENTILVKDALKSLQELATYYRHKNNFKVIGLTGSNGKTTTKELISVVLQQKFKCHATRGNLNNHIGVPLTILSTPADTEILVVEMGANHVGEIAKLSEIAQPDYGLITNIGKAHLEGFGGFEGVIKAKTELYAYLQKHDKVIFVNESDDLLKKHTLDYQKTEYYGTEKSGFCARSTSFKNGVQIDGLIGGVEYSVETRLFGYYNIVNVLTAVKIGAYFEVPVKAILNAIAAYTPTNNRSQIVATKTNSIILDSYNANPSSMQAALESFDTIKHNNKVLILGSMKELGSETLTEHNKLLDTARELNPSNIYLVGSEFECAKTEGEIYFDKTESLILYLNSNQIIDSLILIKGSRANKLETIVDYL